MKNKLLKIILFPLIVLFIHSCQFTNFDKKVTKEEFEQLKLKPGDKIVMYIKYLLSEKISYSTISYIDSSNLKDPKINFKPDYEYIVNLKNNIFKNIINNKINAPVEYIKIEEKKMDNHKIVHVLPISNIAKLIKIRIGSKQKNYLKNNNIKLLKNISEDLSLPVVIKTHKEEVYVSDFIEYYNNEFIAFRSFINTNILFFNKIKEVKLNTNILENKILRYKFDLFWAGYWRKNSSIFKIRYFQIINNLKKILMNSLIYDKNIIEVILENILTEPNKNFEIIEKSIQDKKNKIIKNNDNLNLIDLYKKRFISMLSYFKYFSNQKIKIKDSIYNELYYDFLKCFSFYTILSRNSTKNWRLKYRESPHSKILEKTKKSDKNKDNYNIYKFPKSPITKDRITILPDHIDIHNIDIFNKRVNNTYYHKKSFLPDLIIPGIVLENNIPIMNFKSNAFANEFMFMCLEIEYIKDTYDKFNKNCILKETNNNKDFNEDEIFELDISLSDYSLGEEESLKQDVNLSDYSLDG